MDYLGFFKLRMWCVEKAILLTIKHECPLSIFMLEFQIYVRVFQSQIKLAFRSIGSSPDAPKERYIGSKR